jgi:hypothetical protein
MTRQEKPHVGAIVRPHSRQTLLYGGLRGWLPLILWDVDLGSECIKKKVKMKEDGAYGTPVAETCGSAIGTASGGICVRLTRG